MLLKPTSNLHVLVLLLCDIMYREVKLLTRLKSVQLSTFSHQQIRKLNYNQTIRNGFHGVKRPTSLH